MSELESLQECFPELKVLVFWGVPNEQVAVFRFSNEESLGIRRRSYMIPYVE